MWIQQVLWASLYTCYRIRMSVTYTKQSWFYKQPLLLESITIVMYTFKCKKVKKMKFWRVWWIEPYSLTYSQTIYDFSAFEFFCISKKPWQLLFYCFLLPPEGVFEKMNISCFYIMERFNNLVYVHEISIGKFVIFFMFFLYFIWFYDETLKFSKNSKF